MYFLPPKFVLKIDLLYFYPNFCSKGVYAKTIETKTYLEFLIHSIVLNSKLLVIFVLLVKLITLEMKMKWKKCDILKRLVREKVVERKGCQMVKKSG